MKKKDQLQERLIELNGLLAIKLSKINKPYRDLSEQEKIPLRVDQGEILAMEEAIKGTNLESYLNNLVKGEHYCGAEGFKKAINWINGIDIS